MKLDLTSRCNAELENKIEVGMCYIDTDYEDANLVIATNVKELESFIEELKLQLKNATDRINVNPDNFGHIIVSLTNGGVQGWNENSYVNACLNSKEYVLGKVVPDQD